MSKFLDILDNHRELLSERGYDEVGLGSPDEPGLFMKKLEYHFSECQRKSEYRDDKQDFYIEAFGFFDNDNDIIRFNFHYEFDPKEKDINLKSFSARLDGINRTFLIGPNMYHLIHANKVHKILSDERTLQQSAELIVRPPDIEKMVKEQYQYLTQIGYYDTMFAPKAKRIPDELRAELENMVGLPILEPQDITIGKFLHFSSYEFLQCDFHFVYDPIKPDLKLNRITAKGDEVEITFPVSTKDYQTVQQIHEAIKQAEKIKNAKAIAGYADGTKSLRKKM